MKFCYYIQISSPVKNDNGQETDSGKRRFAVAEADCLDDSFIWPNRKQLYFSPNNEHLDYISHLLPSGATTSAWVGLDKRAESLNWTTR